MRAGEGIESVELRVADDVVGHLRLRRREARRPPRSAAAVATLVALEVERVRGPTAPREAAAAEFLARRAGARADRARRDRRGGARARHRPGRRRRSVVVARAPPARPAEDDWRDRLLAVAERAARATAPGRWPCCPSRDGAPGAEIVVLVPGGRRGRARASPTRVLRELEANLAGLRVRGRPQPPSPSDPVDLHRAGNEALLAANVAEGDAERAGARLRGDRRLPPAAPGHERGPGRAAALLRRDGRAAGRLRRAVRDRSGAARWRPSSTPTATWPAPPQRLFTHRHTVRYRLERVRELVRPRRELHATAARS